MMTRPARSAPSLSVNPEYLGTPGSHMLPDTHRSGMSTWPGYTADSRPHQLYAEPMSESSPTLHLTVVISQEGDWYVARCLEVEAVSQGETVEEALADRKSTRLNSSHITIS